MNYTELNVIMKNRGVDMFRTSRQVSEFQTPPPRPWIDPGAALKQCIYKYSFFFFFIHIHNMLFPVSYKVIFLRILTS